MAIAIAQEVTANGGASSDSVTTGSFTPATGTLLVARASCYAASGDDTSTITIADSLGLTWTKRIERSQNDDGGAINPPPIVIWTATGTGSSMTVTTTKSVGSTGFAHVCVVWVLTGANNTTPIDVSAEQSTTGAASLTLVTTVDNCLLLMGSCDWGETANVPVADGNSTTTYAIANADIQGSWAGYRAVTTAGSYVIGTSSPTGDINAVAVAIAPGSATVSGTAVAALGALTATVSGLRTVLGSVATSLGGNTATASGVRTVIGSANASLGGLAGTAAGTRTVLGTAAITLGGLNGTAVGVRTVLGALAATLGGLTATARGAQTVTGTASASLGGLTATITVTAVTVPQGNGWYGLLSIIQEARDIAAEQRSAPPVACECGEPFRSGPQGQLYCPFDGFQPARGW